jgi:hypothetical protein
MQISGSRAGLCFVVPTPPHVCTLEPELRDPGSGCLIRTRGDHAHCMLDLDVRSTLWKRGVKIVYVHVCAKLRSSLLRNGNVPCKKPVCSARLSRSKTCSMLCNPTPKSPLRRGLHNPCPHAAHANHQPQPRKPKVNHTSQCKAKPKPIARHPGFQS